jgi:hypothetical protein
MLYLQTFEAFKLKKKKKIKRDWKRGFRNKYPGGTAAVMNKISDKDGNLPDLLEMLCERFNVKKVKYRACGFFGMAFLADDDKVIKLTSSKSEASDINQLIGKKIPGCVNYFDIVYSKKFDIYCILMERVEVLKGKEKDMIGQIINTIYTNPQFNDDEVIECASTDDYGNPLYSPDKLKIYLKEIKDLESKLKSAGVSVNDIHSENLGRRNDELVHFDVMSETTRQEDIEKISKLKKRR